MRKLKVLFLDLIPQEIHDIYSSFAPEGVEYVTVSTTNKQELREKAKDADVYMLGGYRVDRETIDMAPYLKLIHLQGVGFEKVDVDYASKKNIYVCISPDGTIDNVAEHTVLFILALMRCLIPYNSAMHSGKYPRWEYRCRTYMLRGKNVGIIGYGRIGQSVSRLVSAFGANVLFYDTLVNMSREEQQKTGIEKVSSMMELCSRSDVVTIHIPYTPESQGLVSSATVFNYMKPTAIFINTARGDLVNKDDLYDVLKNKKILGAASDVFCDAAIDPSDRFVLLDNFILTPHVASGTKDAHIARGKSMFENVYRMMNGQPLKNCINHWF